MKLERVALYEAAGDRIVDADLTPAGEVLVLVRRADGTRACVRPASGAEFPVPPETDYVRGLPGKRTIAASIRRRTGNGRLIDAAGRETACFDLDAPISEILPDWDDSTFWVSYFQIGPQRGLAAGGLVRFDTRGTPTVRFRDEFSGPEASGECHPFCLGEGTRLWIFPEPDFPLLEVDWSSWAVRSWRVPWECYGCDAISFSQGRILFAAPRRHPGAVFAYEPRRGILEEAGVIRGRPRPVRGRREVLLDIHPTSVTALRTPP